LIPFVIGFSKLPYLFANLYQNPPPNFWHKSVPNSKINSEFWHNSAFSLKKEVFQKFSIKIFNCKAMKIRQKLSLTQQQLADLLGVSRSLVNQYEWGKRNLPREALQKLIQLEMESKKVEGKSAPDPTLLFSENGINRLILKYTLKLQRIGEYIVILRMRLKKWKKNFPPCNANIISYQPPCF
jgi:transcriptional regulator with XRE-family HTH domain